MSDFTNLLQFDYASKAYSRTVQEYKLLFELKLQFQNHSLHAVGLKYSQSFYFKVTYS